MSYIEEFVYYDMVNDQLIVQVGEQKRPNIYYITAETNEENEQEIKYYYEYGSHQFSASKENWVCIDWVCIPTDGSIKKEYKIYPEAMEEDDYLKVLLTEEVVFINNGWWDKNWPKDRITFHVNCNDTFSLASADSEDLLYSEIKELYELYEKDKTWGAVVFCIKKRKTLPHPTVKKLLEKDGYNVEELIK